MKINRRDCWAFPKKIVTNSLVFPRARRKDFWECFWRKIPVFANTKMRIWNHVELKIEHKKRKILERFQDIIENNHQYNENTGDYSIYNPAVLNQLRENFGTSLESQESENEEEGHLVNEEEDLIFFRLSVTDIIWKDYKEKDHYFIFFIFSLLLENL